LGYKNSISGVKRGFLIPIGGGEDKTGEQIVLRRFIRLCGGSKARIAIIPTASERRDTGRGYERIFRDLGADSVRVIALRYRSDCDSRDYLDYLDRATGIFMTGGNQMRLSKILLGTRIARRILRRYVEGVHVAGTSAGAAFMPERMISGGVSGAFPEPGMVEIETGLGICPELMVDQHFRQRNRLGRLLTGLALYPQMLGLGIDEDTAAFIGPDDCFEVVGSGGVTVVDPAALQHSMDPLSGTSDRMSLTGLRVHLLSAGGVFDLSTRKASLPSQGKTVENQENYA